MLFIALIILVLVLVGALKYFTAPSVEAHLAAREAYRENMSNHNH